MIKAWIGPTQGLLSCLIGNNLPAWWCAMVMGIGRRMSSSSLVVSQPDGHWWMFSTDSLPYAGNKKRQLYSIWRCSSPASSSLQVRTAGLSNIRDLTEPSWWNRFFTRTLSPHCYRPTHKPHFDNVLPLLTLYENTFD